MNTLTAEWSPTTASLPLLATTTAYNFDVAHAGALYPNGDGTFSRDQVDQQIITQVQSNGSSGSVLNEQDDDGLSNNGFGTLIYANNSSGSVDTVPFSWLMAHGLSTTSAAQLTLPNALGYDMIEEYAQQIGDQYASQTATSGDWAAATWSSTTPGIYDHALIRGNGTTNGAVTIGSADADTAFTVSIGGNGPSAGETLTVSGGSLIVQDTIYVGDQNNGTLTISGGTVQAANVQLGNTVWSANGSSSSTYTGEISSSEAGFLSTGQVVLGGGVAGSWTTGGSINWSGGTLQAAGNLYVNAPVTLGSGGGILDTNGNSATMSGVIGGTGPFTKIGGGALSLTAANTYTGITTISGGSIVVNSLANGGLASEIGAANNSAANLVLDGGTLGFAGTAGASTDRLFTLTVNGGTLDGSGANGDGMGITNTGAIAFIGTGNRTLNLIGTETHNSFLPALGDADANSKTTLVMNGSGRWALGEQVVYILRRHLDSRWHIAALSQWASSIGGR